MTVQELAAQALAERRKAWSAYHAVADIEALEALGRSLTDSSAKEELEAYILRRKRHMKGLFEALEKRGEKRERFAVALAAAMAAGAAWIAKDGTPLQPGLRFAVEALMYALAIVGWSMLFGQGRHMIETARHKLAELGKVD